MSGGPRPKPTIMRLINGETHRDRVLDDKPKVAALPVLPPGVSLTVAESQIWEYLMQHVYQIGVHGTGDGPAFLKVARLFARVNEVDEQLRQVGQLLTPSKLSPLARLSRDLWQQLGTALAEIGATPSGRVRLAGPKLPSGGDGSWSSID